MAKVDIKNLSLAELKALKTRIEKAIAKHDKLQKAKALAALKAKAKSLGFKLDDLVESTGKKSTARSAKKKAPLPAAYRDPADAKNTWSGRGRRPAWVVAAMKNGKSLDDLKI